MFSLDSDDNNSINLTSQFNENNLLSFKLVCLISFEFLLYSINPLHLYLELYINNDYMKSYQLIYNDINETQLEMYYLIDMHKNEMKRLFRLSKNNDVRLKFYVANSNVEKVSLILKFLIPEFVDR